MTDVFDVVIVGGGAAGLSAAFIRGDAVAACFSARGGSLEIRRRERSIACSATRAHPRVTSWQRVDLNSNGIRL